MSPDGFTAAGLIQSKIELPPLAERLVARPRLLERLGEGSERRATLIVAPAGYGKTTLALQWLEAFTGNVAWLSLDEADRDPERFASYLIAALRRHSGRGFDKSRDLLEARTPPPWPYLCETLVAELEGLSGPTVLALEDYHAIDSAEIHDLVEMMVERSPRTFHIAVMTRVEPPWPLASWQARDWLTLLRARHLRFSSEEALDFFASVPGLALDRAAVEALHRRAEGWIAGLRLAQLSLAESADAAGDARELSGSDRQIADYLMSEVLAHQPTEVLEFLTVSALMERFSASLMDHLLEGRTESPDARRMLSRLEKNNLFLVALDRQRQWYRWHHLFRDLLLDHLGHRLSPDLRRRVNREAGKWFAQQDLVEEALEHLIAAGELDDASDLIGSRLHSVMIRNPSGRRLSRWLALFPEDAKRGRLALLIAEAYGCIPRWDLPGLQGLLSEADALDAQRPGSDDHSLRPDIDALWSALHYWQGDIDGAAARAQSALEGGLAVGTRPWTWATQYRAGSLVLSGRTDEAMECLNAALSAIGPDSANVGELLVAQAATSLYNLDLSACRARASLLLERSGQIPRLEYWAGYALLFLGSVAYEENLLDEAKAHFRRIEGMRFVVNSRVYTDALIGRALVAQAEHDHESSDAFCRAARAFASEVADPISTRIISSFELRIAVMRGSSLPADVGPPPEDDHQSIWIEVPSVTWAMRLVADSEPEERSAALAYVESTLDRMKRHHNLRPTVPLSVLRALALDADEEHEAALQVLSETVGRAGPRGFVRSFVDCGPRVKELLDELASRPGTDDSLVALRAAFGPDDQRQLPAGRATGPSALLTFRELETLELLAWRMTNKEIAARLAVSPAAVKKRLESIYAKLEVGDRRAAVAEAVSRKLIAPPTG